MHFKISRPQKKRKAQPGAVATFEAACVIGATSAAACAIGAFIGLHGQKRIKKNSDLAWVQI
jgi:putative Mn2+ efflux pump MntP